MIAALRPNSVCRLRALMFFSNVGFAVPSFLVATLLIYFFALKGESRLPTNGWDGLAVRRSCPSIALGLCPMAYFARLVRGSMLETLQQDYVRTARAKGLRWRRVVGVHVLRNSLIPVVTAAGAAARLHHHRLVRDRDDLLDPGHRPVLRHRRHGARLLGRDGDHGAATPSSSSSPTWSSTSSTGSSTRGRARRGRDAVVDPREACAVRRAAARDVARGAAAGAGAPIRADEPLARRLAPLHARTRAAVIAGGDLRAARRSTCVVWPIVSPYDPNDASTSRRRTRRRALEHPFGTDKFGRDLFTRVALGGRVSIGDRLRRRRSSILADRRRLRLDLRLRRRLARQRDDALPRRALRAAVPAVRDHRARDHRRRSTSGRW